VTESAIELRRFAGKLVMFFAGCYLLVLFGAIVSAVQGTSIPPLNWAVILIPAGAFVPGTYYALKLHMTRDPEQLRAFWPKTLVYGVAGLVLLFSGAYSLYQAGQP
jgi:hypothetical protein